MSKNGELCLEGVMYGGVLSGGGFVRTPLNIYRGLQYLC